MTEHGTDSCYVKGCRKDECRRAHNEAHTRMRRARYAEFAAGEVSPPHGRRSTYLNYGCRCDECTEANRVYVRQHYRDHYAVRR